ncbi:RBBP9/YdeN family alpha/beta hydrolase [Aquicella siphonis]|nr:alpha/beta fold hydrolase [Aquicella siphonis]
MNKNVIIIHGAYGYPDENWFGWLKSRLSQSGVACLVPQLPTPRQQHLETWMKAFDQTVKACVNQHSILIGHSLGAAFILRWLERQSTRIYAAILVGAFIGKVGDEQFDSINHSFVDLPFDWDRCRRNCSKFICYHGYDDPYVSSSQADEIAFRLEAERYVIMNAGHFNTASGYYQFPHLLNNLEALLGC